jgi:hypothetical protein
MKHKLCSGGPWFLETTEVHFYLQVLAVYSTFPALLETLFATFDVDRNGRIDLEAPMERLFPARDMGG